MPQTTTSAPPNPPDFTTVTELSGDDVTRAQVDSALHRYGWAQSLCRGKDVLEIACGSGTGLGMLAAVARSVRAGDVTPALVDRARAHYGDRVAIDVMDAHTLPFPDRSLDVIILFEALYYLPDADQFVREARRVLRPGGVVLITTANKDAPDFNPSPYTHRYFGVRELATLFGTNGFSSEFYGYWSYAGAPAWQRPLVSVKKAAVSLGLMPKTMNGKKLLKRLVFGSLVKMPAELGGDGTTFTPPIEIPNDRLHTAHRLVYCKASLS